MGSGSERPAAHTQQKLTQVPPPPPGGEMDNKFVVECNADEQGIIVKGKRQFWVVLDLSNQRI